MRSIIDRDIVRLEKSIRARNELSPISRLSVKILCNISSLIKDNSILYLGLGPESWTNSRLLSQFWTQRSSALSAGMEEEVRVLKSRRNELSLLSRLPC